MFITSAINCIIHCRVPLYGSPPSWLLPLSNNLLELLNSAQFVLGMGCWLAELNLKYDMERLTVDDLFGIVIINIMMSSCCVY